MSTFNVIFAIVFLVYVAIYNGLFLRAKDEQEKINYKAKIKWEKAWHGWGFLLRIGSVVLITVFFWGNWPELITWTLAMANISWTLFDIIINLFRKKPWYYKGSKQTGTGSLIDRIINNEVLYWLLKFILFISLTISIIL